MKIKCRFCNNFIKVKNIFGIGNHSANCEYNPKHEINRIKFKLSCESRKHCKKEYLFVCLKCNQEYKLELTDNQYKNNKYKKYCSRKCSNSRIWSEYDRNRKRVTYYKNNKVKIAIEKKCIYCNTEFYTKNYKQKFCGRKCCSIYLNKNRIISDEYKNKLSNSLKKQYDNGRNVMGGTTKWYDVETSNGKIRVQGTYEIRTCKILDSWKKTGKIKNWYYTSDKIKYVGVDKKFHNYFLDFKIIENDNNFYYLETKGYEKENDRLKWNAVANLGYKLIVWREIDIKLNEKNNDT